MSARDYSTEDAVHAIHSFVTDSRARIQNLAPEVKSILLVERWQLLLDLLRSGVYTAKQQTRLSAKADQELDEAFRILRDDMQTVAATLALNIHVNDAGREQ